MYYQVKDSHGGKLPPAPVLVWPFLVVWRKIWARYYGYQRTGQRFNLYVDDPPPSVAEEVDDAFDEDDMPLPR